MSSRKLSQKNRGRSRSRSSLTRDQESLSSLKKKKSFKRSVSKLLSKSFRKKKNKDDDARFSPTVVHDNASKENIGFYDKRPLYVLAEASLAPDSISDRELEDAMEDSVGLDDNPLLDHLRGSVETNDDISTIEKKDRKEVFRGKATITKDNDSALDLPIVSRQQQHELEEEKNLEATTAVSKKLEDALVSTVSSIEEGDGNIDREEEKKEEEATSKAEEIKLPSLYQVTRGPSNTVVVGNGHPQPQKKIYDHRWHLPG